MTDNDRDVGRWVRLSGNYPFDPRILAVGNMAELVYVRGLAIARQLGTDGHFALPMLPMLGRGVSRAALNRAAVELVAAGLWETCADGYRVPPARWAKWQTTEAEYAAARARERERKAAWRRRQREPEND